jgi:hypothetical protein
MRHWGQPHLFQGQLSFLIGQLIGSLRGKPIYFIENNPSLIKKDNRSCNLQQMVSFLDPGSTNKCQVAD